jgi:hypothetical protein
MYGLRRAVPPADDAAGFEAIAGGIADRWIAERDTWLGSTEVEAARCFLERSGVPVRALADGSFLVASAPQAVSPARLFVLALRRLRVTSRIGVMIR